MMKNLSICAIYILCFCCMALMISCQEQRAQFSSEIHPELVGTWVLTARIIQGQETPAKNRVVKLIFRKDGTFETSYKGETGQEWVQAGRGAYSYNAPILSLHWDSGRIVPLLLTKVTAEGFRAHHGRDLAPLKDQEPDEIFEKVQNQKGPTRSSGSEP